MGALAYCLYHACSLSSGNLPPVPLPGVAGVHDEKSQSRSFANAVVWHSERNPGNESQLQQLEARVNNTTHQYLCCKWQLSIALLLDLETVQACKI